VAVARRLVQHRQQSIVEPHKGFRSQRRTENRLYAVGARALSKIPLTIPKRDGIDAEG